MGNLIRTQLGRKKKNMVRTEKHQHPLTKKKKKKERKKEI
jgi:hypothetical protein